MKIGKWDLFMSAFDSYTINKKDLDNLIVRSVRVEDTTNNKFYRFKRFYSEKTRKELGVSFTRLFSKKQIKTLNVVPKMVAEKLLELTKLEAETN